MAMDQRERSRFSLLWMPVLHTVQMTHPGMNNTFFSRSRLISTPDGPGPPSVIRADLRIQRPLISSNIMGQCSGAVAYSSWWRRAAGCREWAAGCFSCKTSLAGFPSIIQSRGNSVAPLSIDKRQEAAFTLPFITSSATFLALALDLLSTREEVNLCWIAISSSSRPEG